jgi:hypothetical protein
MQPSPVARALSSVALGPETAVRDLVMFPLLRRESHDPASERPCVPYIVLDEALASGSLEITEISAAGRVPDLRVVNRGPAATLLLDGEELLGAKQNRIVNLTVLVPGHAEITIPVSCVEAGRWQARSRLFAASPQAQYAVGRAKRNAQVTESIRSSGSRFSDHADIWSDIAAKSGRLRSSSPTGAMQAMFLDHADYIDACVEALSPVEGQVGALFAIGGRVVGFDLFASDATFGKLLPKLVRSVAIDARDAGGGGSADAPPPSTLRTRAGDFLHAAAEAALHVAPAVGLGEDVRLSAPGLTGAALVVEEQVLHLAAFAIAQP